MKPTGPTHRAKGVPGGHSHANGGEDRAQGMPTGARDAAPPVHLTRREQQVLALMCEGLSNKGIARRLHIAPSTVKVHIAKIFRTLNVSNRVNAVLRSRCWELVGDSPSYNQRPQPGLRGGHRGAK